MKRDKNIQTIVVSGINLFTGGTLKVMQDCIAALSAYAGNSYQIIAMVHDEKLYPAYANVKYITFPKSRKSWLFRLYYEYIGFYRLSKRLEPSCWFSMHDLTPRVRAGMRLVYCHSSFPFYQAGWNDFRLQYPIFMFSVFLKHIYRINIRKNKYVIVQQEATRESFRKMYGIRNIVVSLPVQNFAKYFRKDNEFRHTGKIFFYPASPMIHKNFGIICQALSLLEKKGVTNLEVILTIDGKENKYSRHLYKKYKHLKNLKFAGYLSREDITALYEACDYLIFPSKTESWGLPLTEAKEMGKNILAANLPYAKETIGQYDRVKFFDPDDASILAGIMKEIVEGKIRFDETAKTVYHKPFAENWDELLKILFHKPDDNPT